MPLADSVEPLGGRHAGIGLTGHGGGATGSLQLIMGPMFAGKTTALLRSVSELRAGGEVVELVKSSKDDRYAEEAVVSHDGTMQPC